MSFTAVRESEVSADNDASSWKAILWATVLGACGLLLFVLYAVNAGYDSRRHVGNAIAAAVPVKDLVMAYRMASGKWPVEADAGRLRLTPNESRGARSIVYDPSRKAIVITMAGPWYEGKRFEFVGEDRVEGPVWSCRRIDIDAKYLPASCR
jgi:hypothetical protein